MSECLEGTKKIIELEPKAGTIDKSSRDWLAVTTPNNGGSRDTVRIPYPVGDREAGCQYCNGTGVYENPNTGRGESCPYCQGTGDGVISVSGDGVVSLKYDGGSFVNTETGLKIKVDNETIAIDPVNGLVVLPVAHLAPIGYLSTGDIDRTFDGIIAPESTIDGKYISIDPTGLIYGDANLVKGFVAKLSIDIANDNFENCNELVTYTVETDSTEDSWSVVYDTTKPSEHFEFSTIVSRRVADGVKFSVAVEGHSAEYSVGYTLDVHSF